MEIKNIIRLLASLILVFMISCEDMDDTYSEHTDFGKIRYTGKCKNLSVQLGYQRCVLNWENSDDKTIKKILVKVIEGQNEETFELPADAVTFNSKDHIDALGNNTYIFRVISVDANDKESIAQEVYARPFTNEHEIVFSFVHVENNFYFSQDDVKIFLSKKQPNLESAQILYQFGGEDKVREITDQDFEKGYILLTDIDVDSSVKIDRVAKPDDCIDVIDFEPYELDKNLVTMGAEFASFIKRTYHIEAINKEALDKITTLYLDIDLPSSIDIFYFNNLEKIVLGGHRYFDPMHTYSGGWRLSEVLCGFDEANKQASLDILKMWATEKPGRKIEVYNNHYDVKRKFATDFTLMGKLIKKDNPEIPSNITIIDSPKDENGDLTWSVSVNTEEGNYLSHPEYLLDNDKMTAWIPLDKENELRTHEILIDLKESVTFNGFLVRQPMESTLSDEYFAKNISVRVSNDQVTWKNPFSTNMQSIGEGRGETNILTLKEVESAQFIKLMIKDRVQERKNVFLSDFIPVMIN